VARQSTLLWCALPTPASADGKIEPGCNVRQAQAGAVLPSADLERGIDARRAALVGVTGAGPRIDHVPALRTGSAKIGGFMAQPRLSGIATRL